MIPFFLAAFVVYGSFHLYAFRKITGALRLAPSLQIWLAVMLMLMLLAPFFVRMAERYGFPVLTRLFAYAGYSWMGFLFLFVCLSLFFDLFRLLVFLSRFLLPGLGTPLFLSAGGTFAISLVLSLGIAVYGWFEAQHIRRETITIKTSRIPAAAGRIRIAQISDVHLGVMVGERRLGKIRTIIREAAPDILVSTGDLVDGQGDDFARYMESFRALAPPLGKFAVTGNHELYAGLEQALALTRGAGFRVLRGEAVTVAGAVTIAGVDDPVVQAADPGRKEPEATMLAALPRDCFTIFLKHRPLVREETLDRFDLQLSGHTHKGQIFPFNLVTHLFFPRQGGFFRLSDRSSLYASRGTGTWGPSLRFLAPPEVTLIDLVPADSPGMIP